MGGYFDYSYFNTYKVMCATRFMANAGQIPEGNWLGSATSVSSGGGTPSGWVFQSGVALLRNNDVVWAPQTWYLNQLRYDSDQPVVGTGDIIRFYERIEIRSWVLHDYLYVYDEAAWYNDTPDVWEWQHLSAIDKLLVGTTTYSGKKYKYFQFGVESPSRVTTTACQVVHDNPCYHYSGTTWKYKNARVCRGSNAWITRSGSTGYRVGGLDYTRVDLYFTQPEEVIWQYTGSSTVADEQVLWTQSGTVADSHRVPYQQYYP